MSLSYLAESIILKQLMPWIQIFLLLETLVVNSFSDVFWLKCFKQFSIKIAAIYYSISRQLTLYFSSLLFSFFCLVLLKIYLFV